LDYYKTNLLYILSTRSKHYNKIQDEQHQKRIAHMDMYMAMTTLKTQARLLEIIYDDYWKATKVKTTTTSGATNRYIQSTHIQTKI
jgi:hypothetical protein